MPEHHEQKHPEHNVDGIVENRENSPPPYFTILFYGLILWGVAFCAYYLLSGWSSEKEFTQNMQLHQKQHDAAASQPTTASEAQAAAPAKIDAAPLFAQTCAVCHGADATGGIGPNLTGDYKYGKNTAGIVETITKGRPGGMPAFGNQLSQAEIEALAAYLLAL